LSREDWRTQPGVSTHKRKDKTGIATKRRKRRKKKVDEKTSVLGYGTGIAAKEHKDRKKKSGVRIY
jgi:hypothetical protein